MLTHSMQFLVSQAKSPPIANWISTPLVKDRWMHHCPLLPVRSAFTTDGVEALLVGWAFDLADGKGVPEVQISTLGSKDLFLRYRTWVGRWMLLVGDHIHCDAMHSIPAFFGHGLVSSSLHLIREISGAGLREHRQISCGIGPDWYPGPRTPVLGVARLLPSQTLPLATFRPEYRPLLARVSVRDSSLSLREALVRGIGQLNATHQNVFVALTGGLDSRTVLACAYVAGMRPTAYTQDHEYLSPGDRLLPPLLAKRLGLSHQFIRRQEFDLQRQAIFDEHCMSQCVGGDRDFYSYGQWNAFPAGSLILRGGGFEFGRAYYYRKIPRGFDPALPDAGERLHTMLYHPLNRISGPLASAVRKRQSFMTESLSEWLSWVAVHPEPHLDFRDRFYLEQRLGCWGATTEQALDLTGTVRIHISNSHYVFSLMNLAALNEREGGANQKAAIETLTPAIASFPFNPTSKWRRVRQKTIGNLSRVSKALSFLAGKRLTS
jgi:hypothetical protein